MSIGRFEKDIKELSEDNLTEYINANRKLEEKLGECAENLKAFEYWMIDQQELLDINALPFRVGDAVGWEERRNHGTRFEYRVFRRGTLHSIKRRDYSRWNDLSKRHELKTGYEYVIQLPGKSRKTCSSEMVDLLTLEDLETAKKEYTESLEAVKASFTSVKPKTKKAK